MPAKLIIRETFFGDVGRTLLVKGNFCRLVPIKLRSLSILYIVEHYTANNFNIIQCFIKGARGGAVG
jgi:hypothetical protein